MRLSGAQIGGSEFSRSPAFEPPEICFERCPIRRLAPLIAEVIRDDKLKFWGECHDFPLRSSPLPFRNSPLFQTPVVSGENSPSFQTPVVSGESK